MKSREISLNKIVLKVNQEIKTKADKDKRMIKMRI